MLKLMYITNSPEVANIAEAAGVPFTNYGTAIACMNGILRRSLGIFPDLAKEISE